MVLNLCGKSGMLRFLFFITVLARYDVKIVNENRGQVPIATLFSSKIVRCSRLFWPVSQNRTKSSLRVPLAEVGTDDGHEGQGCVLIDLDISGAREVPN